MKTLALAAVAAFAATSGAFAADPPMAPPPVVVAPVFDWSGLYVGATGGYTFGTGVVNIPGYASTFNESVNGFIAGVHAGANFLVGPRFVLGVEGDIHWSGASGSALSGGGPPGELYNINQTWVATARGRAGIIVADKALLYVTGGLAGTSLSTQYVPSALGTRTATVGGWTAGFGADVAVTERLSLRGEYRYSSYGLANYVHAGPSNVSYSSHSVLFGFSFHP